MYEVWGKSVYIDLFLMYFLHIFVKNVKIMGVIYLRTNLINGKQYVGQTNNFRRREYEWKNINQRYSTEDSLIDNARKKYGINNFNVEILKECDDNELDLWEMFYIQQYQTKKPYGYNLTDGGCGNRGYTMSEETRKRISENNGRYWKGKKRSEDVKEAVRIANASREGYWLGKKRDEETVEKIKKSRKKKKVLQYTVDGQLVKLWDSITEASKNGFNYAHIVNCCKGKYGFKTHKGYIWKFLDQDYENYRKVQEKETIQ